MPADPIPMPDPGKRSSPFFDGKDEELAVFFEDFDHHAVLARLDEDGRKKEVLRYVGRAQKELWEKLTKFSNGTWIEFVDEVKGLYPAADESHKYTINDLEVLAQRTRDNSIRSIKEFGQYRRDFLRVSGWLLEQKKASDLEVARIFWRAFPNSLRDQTRAHLKHIVPDHDPRDPYKIEDVTKAAIWVLTDLERDMDPEEASEARGREKKSEKDRDFEDRRAKRYLVDVPKHEVKREEVPDAYRDLLSRVEQKHDQLMKQQQEQITRQRNLETANSRLLAALQELSVNSRAPVAVPQQLYNPNQSQEERNRIFGYAPKPNRPLSCRFCDDPSHMIKSCPVVDQFIREGKCMRGTNGSVMMANGEAIPNIRGRSLRSAVEETIARVGMLSVGNQTGPAKSSSGPASFGSYIIEASPAFAQSGQTSTPVTTYYQNDDNNSQLFEDSGLSLLRELEVFVQRQKEAQPAHPMNTRGKGNRDPIVDRGTLPKEVPTVRPSQPTVPAVPIPTVQIARPPPRSTNQLPQGPVLSYPPPVDPQYRLRNNAEDPNLVDNLQRRVLDQEIHGVTFAHLLAASPSLRSSFATKVKTQRVEVNHIDVMDMKARPDELQVSHEAVPLAEIDLMVNHTLHEKAITDCGSQINVVREDCWREMNNVVVYSEASIMMESADTSLSRTHGKLKDLPITIGNTTFYIQAQVVPKAPCRILLGKPFFALTEAKVHTDRMGFTTLYLSNPNPPFEQIVVAARHRVKPAEAASQVALYESSRGRFEEVEAFGKEGKEIPQVMSSLAILQDRAAVQFFH